MKKNFSILLLSSSILLAGFVTVNDVLSEVGATMQELKDITIEQVARKQLDVPSYTSSIREACKGLPAGVREATMMNVGKILKEYVSSPEFAKEYTAYVNTNFDNGKSGGTTTSSADRDKRIDEYFRSMENGDTYQMLIQMLDQEIMMAQMNLEMIDQAPDIKLPKSKAEYKKDIDDINKLKKLKSTDETAFKKGLAVRIVNSEMQTQTDYNKSVSQDKEKEFKELLDYKTIIRKQLKEFLDLSASVDFNAKTVMRNGRMEFANPEYEGKPSSWKFCYRAGKEAVGGARKFVQGWLGEMK